MKREVNVRDVTIGSGRTKICVPLVGSSIERLVEEARVLSIDEVDIIEWRVDFFNQVGNIDEVKKALKKIRQALPDKPIIFTFRTEREGGEQQSETVNYFQLNKQLIETKLIDIVDIELYTDEQEREQLIVIAHENDMAVIISNHDFEGTPSKDEIISRLCLAQDIGGDIAKLAAMPHAPKDVLTVLEATEAMAGIYATGPIITMAMGKLGVITRISGGVFGSAVTFAAASKVSAPGQLLISELKNILVSLE